MLKKSKVVSLFLGLTPILVSYSPAQAQAAPFVRGGYRYEVLAMNSYCENAFPDGKMIGNRQLVGNAWHSPIGTKNIRCKYKYAMTYSTQLGGSIGFGGIGGSGSRTDNETEVKDGVIEQFSYSSMCKFQQNTTKYLLSKNRQFVYCGRPI